MSSDQWLQLFDLVSRSVSALAAVVAVFLTTRVLRASKTTHEAQIVLRARDDYYSQEMGDAQRVLIAYRNANDDAFADRWNRLRLTDDEEASRVTQALRRLKRHYEGPAEAYRFGLLSRRALQAITFTAGLNTLYEIAEPLERARTPGGDFRWVETLQREVGGFQDGTIWDAKPRPKGKPSM